MVARQIRERRRAQLDAVDAMLGESDARRLERHVIDAFIRELGQQPMDFDRIGRRQIERPRPRRRHDTDGPKTRRLVSEMRPNLTHE